MNTIIVVITSVQSNLHKAASPPQTDSCIIFIRWHQCDSYERANVPSHEGTLAPPGEYDWTCAYFGPPRVHNPNGKSIASAVFAELTAESLYTLQWAPVSPKIAPSHGGICRSGPLSNTLFLGPILAHNTNGISIDSAVFAQMTAMCPYTLQWDAPFPSKLPFPTGDLDPHLMRGSLGPPESSTQTTSWSVQPLLQGSLMWQADRPPHSVDNNRPHLRT